MRRAREYTPRVTKALEAFAARNAATVQEVYSDPDGVWIHLKPGFIFQNMECGTCRGDTAAELFRRMGAIVEGQIIDGHSCPKR